VERKAAVPRIGVILSTIREGRFGEKPGRWILQLLEQRTDLSGELIDLRDYPLPLFDDVSPAYAPSSNEIARRWAARIASLDGYLFITAEYNRSIPGVLKNALDYLFREFARKPAAFVGYGGLGGARAVEHLRLICVELQMVPTRNAVHIDGDRYMALARGEKSFEDFDSLQRTAMGVLDELAWWVGVLSAVKEKPVRQVSAA
jgi:NAD(P)H-dependent FMN reductase